MSTTGTSDNLTDTTVRVDAADLVGVCRIHLDLPTKQESCKQQADSESE